ncbi:MAG: sulfotransferase [Chthoniobacterales bacterium]
MTARTNPSFRATKAFCVGQAKSGTASLCGLLAKNYRAAHEPERAQLLAMILEESRGQIVGKDFYAYLLERDRRLNLEYDIAWANQFIMGYLLEAFPDARFIVLIRDVESWLRAIVGHLLSRKIPSDVRAFLDWWFKPAQYPHSRGDRALATQGLYSMAAFLNAWNRHLNSCIQTIPPDKRLILRTDELNQSHQRLASFLKIPVAQLDTLNGHLNRGTWSGELDGLVERAYLDEMIAQICGENMRRYFASTGHG